MDFAALKEKAIKLKDKTIELKNKTVDFTAEKVSTSGLVIKTQTDLEKLITKSENKVVTTKEGEEKVFVKRSMLVVGDSQKDFFKEFLLSIPVLLTKSFTQSISLKMVDIHDAQMNLDSYNLSEMPVLIVFENKEVYKTIIWEDNIKKVVKSFTLDINKSIEEI